MNTSFKRKLAILFFLLTFVAVTSNGYSQEAAPKRENDAITELNRDIPRFQSQSEIMARGNVDLLMIGDSITQGWEGAGKAVWKEYYSSRNAMNFGIGGDRTQHVLWRLAHSPIDKISPKMAVVMIGTNNVGAGTGDRNTPEETVEGIQKVVSVLKEKFPNMKILLLEVFPRSAQATDLARVKVDGINKGLRESFKNIENVELFGFGEKFLDAEGNLSKEIMPDLLHLNDKSYRIWAESIEPKIAAVLGPLSKAVASPAVVIPREESVALRPTDKLNEKWWKDRFEAQHQRMSQGNVDLLMIGDSITHGWEGKGKEVWDKFYANRNAMNFGISADRTEHVIWRLLHSPLDKIAPKMAVIMIGTNNIGHGSSSPAETVKGIQKIIAILKDKYPAIKILLLEVFPRGETSADALRQKVDEINAGLRKTFVHVENVQLYNIGDLFLDSTGTLPKAIMPDLLHPGTEGYQTWACAMEPKIVEGLGEELKETQPAPRLDMPNNWWMKRFEEQNDRLKEGNVDLVFVGDSITHRWEKDRKRDAVPGIYPDNGADVWNQYYAGRNAVNLGTDGDQTQHVIWRLTQYDWSKAKPKMAVVLIGVNNTSGGASPPENIAMGIRTIVKLLQEKSPGINVLVLKILPCQLIDAKHGPRQALIDPVNEILPSYLRGLDRVTLLDIGKVFENENGEVTTAIMPDKIHLSAEGYLREAKAIEPFIAK